MALHNVRNCLYMRGVGRGHGGGVRGAGEREGVLRCININSCTLQLPIALTASCLLSAAVERANQLREMVETASFRARTSHTDRTRFEPIWQRLDPHVPPKHGHPVGVSPKHRTMGTAEALAMFACMV